MWCWPHELKQPLVLMRSPSTAGSKAPAAARSESRDVSSAASPRDEAMPSLHVSVPGQAVMSARGPGSGPAEPDGRQLAIQGGQVGLAHPAQDDVLLDRRPHRAADVPPRQIGQPAHLTGGQVAERQCDGDGGVTGLALAVDVGARPAREAVRAAARRPPPPAGAAARLPAARRRGARSSAGRRAGRRALRGRAA